MNQFKLVTRQCRKSVVCQAFMCTSQLFEMHMHEREHVPFCTLKAGIFGSVCGLERCLLGCFLSCISEISNLTSDLSLFSLHHYWVFTTMSAGRWWEGELTPQTNAHTTNTPIEEEGTSPFLPLLPRFSRDFCDLQMDGGLRPSDQIQLWADVENGLSENADLASPKKSRFTWNERDLCSNTCVGLKIWNQPRQ